MKKIDWTGFGVFMMILTPILGFILSGYMIVSGYRGMTQTTAKYDKTLGTRVVLDKDTLTVIDYSMIKSTVKLSNNNSIAVDFYDKIVIKEKNGNSD